MRFFRFPLRGAAVLGTVAAGLAVATPALAADVVVSPASAVQGDGTNLSFRVTNDHPSASITAVRLALPAANPIAEAYPLSVPDWAPQTVNRPLDPPAPGLHGGLMTEAAGSIIWTAAAGKAIKPGGSADLTVALGPMPAVPSMTFTVQPTYSDGSAAPGAPVVLRLLPPAPVEPAEHVVVAPGQVGAGPSWWSISGWLAAAAAVVFGVAGTVRARRRSAATVAPDSHTVAAERAEPPAPPNRDADADASATTPAAATPVEAGKSTRVTAWSYRDGP